MGSRPPGSLLPRGSWRRHRIRSAGPYLAPGHSHLDRAFLDTAFQPSHDSSLDGVPRPGEQQTEPDKVGEDPWREEQRTPRKHGHPIHDGLRRNAPILEVIAQPPQGPESLLARQPSTRDTRKDDQSDRGPKPDHLAHLNEKRQFQERHDDEEEG